MTPFTGSNKSAVIGMLDDTDSTATKYYAVAKLADNRCWMISNYAKPYGTFITNIASNWNSTENATNTAYYTSPSNTGVTPIRNTRACTGNGYASTAADAIASLDDSGKTAASSIHNCGYLYNWYGATAGTGTSTSDYEVVTGSICPTGWHLPTTDNVGTIPNAWGTDKQEFMTLWANLNSDYDKVVGSSSAFRGVRSGNVANDAYLETQGEDGLYWSSVARSTTNAYSFSFNGGSGVFPRDSHRKYLGFSVRCILNAN
jgi:uncharacterized protein (TIGR02145 family)